MARKVWCSRFIDICRRVVASISGQRSWESEQNKFEYSGEGSRFGNVVLTLQRLLQRFALGLNALNNKRQVLVLITLTLTIWFLEFSIMFVVFLMFGLNLSFVAAIVTGVILSIGMMIPAAPGAIGTYQFFTVTGLQLYHVPEGQAWLSQCF